MQEDLLAVGSQLSMFSVEN